MQQIHDTFPHGRRWHAWMFVPLTFAFFGCGGRDVTGPTPVAKMSTEKVSYKKPPGPGLQRIDLAELVVTEKLEPLVLSIPSPLDRNTEIIFKGSLRWPKTAGKITMLRLEFFQLQQNVEVTLTETIAMVEEKDGLYPFETERIKTPVKFVGKCTVRLWANTIPSDFDPSLGVLPKRTAVVVGLAEVEMR